MTGVLLDTNVVSELARSAPVPEVRRFIADLAPASAFISAITIGELTQGVIKLPAGARRSGLQSWLGSIEDRFAGHVLAFDAPTASIWGELMAAGVKAGRTAPAIDAQIAATAIRHGLTLATRNVRDFRDTPVRLTNPWELSP